MPGTRLPEALGASATSQRPFGFRLLLWVSSGVVGKLPPLGSGSDAFLSPLFDMLSRVAGPAEQDASFDGGLSAIGPVGVIADDEVEEMISTRPGLQVVEIGDSAHDVHLDQPDLVAGPLNGVVGELRARGTG